MDPLNQVPLDLEAMVLKCVCVCVHARVHACMCVQDVSGRLLSIKGVGHFYRNMPEAREISRGDLGLQGLRRRA